MRNLENNIAIFIDSFHVCDVITLKAEIGGQFYKYSQNGTTIWYDLDHNGGLLPPKLTNLWTENFFRPNCHSEVMRYIFLTPYFKDRSTIGFSQ